MKTRNPFTDTSASARLPLVALLLIQGLIAYEWVNSALTKIVNGGFATGLGEELAKNSDGAPGWYQTVLNSAIVPHSVIFGYMVEVGELAVGITLFAAAVLLFTRASKMQVATLRAVLAIVALTAVGGAFMNFNFSLFGGDPPVWALGSDAFSEGVGIDGILMLMQAAMATVSLAMVYSLRPERATQSATVRGYRLRHAAEAV